MGHPKVGGGLIPTFTAALSRIGEDGAPEGVGGCGFAGFPPKGMWWVGGGVD